MSASLLRILLIDDDDDSYVITRGLLSQVQGAAINLEWAGTYEAGLAALRRGEYDACLLDYRLGARDGLELLREALAEGCRPPIIMLTGQSDHDIDLQAMRAGAADYLVKDTFDASLASIRPRGTLVLFGGSSGQVPPFDLQRLNAAGSLYVTRPSINAYARTRAELAGRADELFSLVADGALRVRIGARFPLAQAADAHRALEGRATTGKVLLTL